MKKLICLFTIILSIHGHADFRETSDIHFFIPPKKVKNIVPLFNSITSSLSYAIWTNQILNGSGTKAKNRPLEKEFEAQQLLRILSLFDLSLTRSIKKMENEIHGAQHLVYLYAPMEKKNLDEYKDFAHPLIIKGKKVIDTILPKKIDWPLKKIPEVDVQIQEGKTKFSPILQKRLNLALEKRLSNFWNHVENLNLNKNGKTGLEDFHALYQSLFVPFSVLCEIRLDKLRGSSYKISLFLPSLFSLEKNKRQPFIPYSIFPGLNKDLPFPLDTPMAQFQKMNYLKTDITEKSSYQEAKERILKLELTKNFNNLDQIDVSIKMGSLRKEKPIKKLTLKKKIKNFFKKFRKKEKKKHVKLLGLYPMDMTDMRSGVALDGFVNLPILKKNSRTNQFLNKIKMRLFFNRLYIKLVRPSTKSFEEAFTKNLSFKPVFDVKKSSLSFRLKKGVNKRSSRFVLDKLLGFHCKPNDVPEIIGPYKTQCIQDFSTMNNFNSEYYTRFGKNIKRFGVKSMFVFNLKHTLETLRTKDIMTELKKKSPEIIQKLLNEFKKTYDEFHLTIGDPF